MVNLLSIILICSLISSQANSSYFSSQDFEAKMRRGELVDVSSQLCKIESPNECLNFVIKRDNILFLVVKDLEKTWFSNIIKLNNGFVYKIVNPEHEQMHTMTLREINIGQFFKTLSPLSNKFVVSFNSCCIEHTYQESTLVAAKYFIEMPYFDKGTLEDFLSLTNGSEKSGRIDWKWNVAMTTLNGVKLLHDSGFIHRDLKPKNIFMKNDFEASIGDYNFVVPQSYHARDDPIVESSGYAAPEVFSKQEYSRKSDIYALGKIFFQIFNNHSLNTVFVNNPIDYAQYCELNFDVHPFSTEALEHELFCSYLKGLILEMADADPSKRPTLEKIKATLDSLLPELKALHKRVNAFANLYIQKPKRFEWTDFFRKANLQADGIEEENPPKK